MNTKVFRFNGEINLASCFFDVSSFDAGRGCYTIQTFTSKYVGVSFVEKEDHYKAVIQVNGVVEYLGYFKNEIDAANAYIKRLNQVENEI